MLFTLLQTNVGFTKFGSRVNHSSVTQLPATGVLAKHRHHEDLKLILEGGHRFYKPPGAY
jgi:hypothetical protein